MTFIECIGRSMIWQGCYLSSFLLFKYLSGSEVRIYVNTPWVAVFLAIGVLIGGSIRYYTQQAVE